MTIGLELSMRLSTAHDAYLWVLVGKHYAVAGTHWRQIFSKGWRGTTRAIQRDAALFGLIEK